MRRRTVQHAVDIDNEHLNRIMNLDVENRVCVVEPGIVLDDLNRQLKAHGLWFPDDVSTSSRATIGGMTTAITAWQQVNPLWDDARQCAWH